MKLNKRLRLNTQKIGMFCLVEKNSPHFSNRLPDYPTKAANYPESDQVNIVLQ